MKSLYALCTAVLMALALVACQSAGTSDPVLPTSTGQSATPTLLTSTPTPVPTPAPSATPTAESVPTVQPTPTASPTVPPTATPTHTPSPSPTPVDAREYEMVYEIERPTVLGQQTVVDQLWLPLPNTDGGGTLALELLDVYPDGYKLLDIGGTNRAAYWGNVGQLCQQTDCRFGIRFRVTLERPMYTIPWSEPVTYDPQSAVYQTYTQPQRGVESDDATIRSLAERIVGEEANPYRQVLAIQSWIQSNVRYPDLGSTYPDDALRCIAEGVGDCAGQSKVFVALARALGIPARTVSGLRPFEADVGQLDHFPARSAWFERTLDVHVWCEVYFPALGWVQCEPDMPGFGIDKERLITKRGLFEFPGGLCRQATYFHLPLAVQGDWCGQSVGWEVSIDAQPIE